MRSGFFAAAASSGSGPGAPGVVTNVAGTIGVGQISVTWSAPISNGGSAITDYAVQYSSDSGSNWATFADGVSTAASATVTGLSAGTSYTFRVLAKNAIGDGPYSTASAAVSTATVPGPPGTPSVTTCQSTQVPLTWSAPVSNGGSAVTDYVVEYSTSATFVGGGTVFADGTSASTTATVSSLINGTPYYFRVAATNAVGTGSYSGISLVATPATVPNAPTSVSGTSNASGQSSVSWVAPSGAGTGGNGPPFTFTVQYSTSATFASAVTTFGTTSSSPLTVNGLTNGTTYYFRVKATNCAGDSSYSSISAGAVPAAAPGAPTSVSATSGSDGYSTVSWGAAASNGATVTYTVEYSTVSNFSSGVTSGGTTTSLSKNVFSLSNGTTYYFRVYGTNSAGTGPNSAISAGAVPYGVPTVSAPTITNYNQNRATFNASPTANGSAVTQIEWRYGTDNVNFANSVIKTNGDTFYNQTGFANGTAYYVQVRASNAAGASSWSSSTSFTTWALIHVTSTVLGAYSFSIPSITPTGGSTLQPTIYDVLIYGGGGGGASAGGFGGGGGGGGGYRIAASKLSSVAGTQNLTGTIGGGGAANGGFNGNNFVASEAGGSTTLTFGDTTYTAGGGGGGGTGGTGPGGSNGGAVGSGDNTAYGGGAAAGSVDKNGAAMGGGGGGGTDGAGGNGSVSGYDATSGNGGNGGGAYGLNGGSGGGGFAEASGTATTGSNGTVVAGGTQVGRGGHNGAAGSGGGITFKYYGP